MSTPSPRQSRMALARSTALALPLISMPISAPFTSTSSTSTTLSPSSMPIESDISGSARMRKPLRRAPLTPSAMTAGPLLMGAARSLGSRGTRARSVTPSLRRTCSRSSPSGTSTVSPARASAMAAAIVVVTAITRGAITTGAGCHIVRVSHPSATAATNPATNSRARAAHGLRRSRPRRPELFALHHQHRDVVLASRAIRRRDQFPHGAFRITGITLHRGANFRRGDLIAQAIAAQQQRAGGFERKALHFDEIRVAGSMLLAAHIAKNLVAARVAHGVRLAQLAIVFALAHRRMIVRDLADFAAPPLVEPRIAHVAHPRRAILHEDQREHARHPLEFRVSSRRPQSFVVGHGDRLADALFHGAGLPLQARAHPLHGDLRPLPAGSLPADAVYHQEDAALRVDMERVLVVAPHASRVARPRAPDVGLIHSMCFGTPGTPRPRGRCAPAPAPAPPDCGRAFRRLPAPCWSAPSRRRSSCPTGSGP